MANVLANLAFTLIRMKQSAKNASATAQNAFPKQRVPLAQFKATSSSTVLAFLRLAIMDFLEIRLRGFANLAPRTVLLVSKELTSARLAPIQGPNSLQKQGLASHASWESTIKALRLVDVKMVTFSIRFKTLASPAPTLIARHVQALAANARFAKIILRFTRRLGTAPVLLNKDFS